MGDACGVEALREKLLEKSKKLLWMVVGQQDDTARSKGNSLAYLTHIKDESKIQYAPEDVVTLAGTDYMDYFNENKERWIKARAIVAKKGGKPLDRRFREAISKLESGELSCEELAGIPEYRKLFLSGKYQRKLEAAGKRVEKLANLDKERLKDKYQNGEISMEEARAILQSFLYGQIHSAALL